MNYTLDMENRPSSSFVTLMLRHPDGSAWALRLSRDCLRFIGRYQRIDGFDIDAMTLFDGMRRAG